MPKPSDGKECMVKRIVKCSTWAQFDTARADWCGNGFDSGSAKSHDVPFAFAGSHDRWQGHGHGAKKV